MSALTARLPRVARFSLFETAIITLVAALIALAIVGPWLAPDTIYLSDIRQTLQPPSAAHWFGTDDQGRDIFWRVIAGARATLLSSFAIVTGYSIIGVAVATAATAGSRWVDETLMRLTDIGLALPSIIVTLGFAAALGPSLQSAIIAKAITGWPVTARLLRTIMKETTTRPFVQGAITLGCSRWRVMLHHVLPNSLDVLYVKWAGDISVTILLLAAMSFIGVGAQPPSAEWGAMLAGAKGYVTTAWWAIAAPGFAIALASIGFGLLGDILQVRRDPTLADA